MTRRKQRKRETERSNVKRLGDGRNRQWRREEWKEEGEYSRERKIE